VKNTTDLRPFRSGVLHQEREDETEQREGLGEGDRDEHRRLEATGHLRLAGHGLDGLAADDADAEARADCGKAVGDTLTDGRTFKTIEDFKKLILANPEQIARSITEKLMVYSTGHTVSFTDEKAVNAILAEAKKSDYGLRTLVHAIVASELFLTK